ncbi:MAG: hypothetical protein GWN07_06595, partial [Actinobacteria bacterium]|nr:hypothetical protein [Actinomycetota bacterium]NIU65154.1 hypothetical protein [Actinomycetota bacterium]NIW26962.1 hypothetical protein [Actinomycetota bacterium]NIX19514.1 hypothetical protein [Actinomycetota bacterium]
MRTLDILIPWLSLVLGCAANMTGSTARAPEDPEPAAPPPGATIEILEPGEGEILPANLVRVSGTADVDVVTVNGEEVDVVEGRFAAALEMPDGPATVVARASDATDSVSFVVDGRAPIVEIRLPGRGAFIDGNLLTVQGVVHDDDVSEVSVDGNVVPVNEDGSFSFSTEVAPGAYDIRVSATDAAGHTGYAMTSALVGTFQPIDQLVDRAAVLQVGESALDEIGDGIAPHISPENLEPAILSYGHLRSGFWGHLDAEGYDHRAVDVTVDPGPAILEVTVGVDDISLPLRADLTIGPDITGTAYADRAVASVTARLSSDD